MSDAPYAVGETWSVSAPEREWWATCDDAPGGETFVTVASDRYADPVALIPIAMATFGGDDLIKARARLISKAPEMAELLSYAHDLIQSYVDTHGELNDDNPEAHAFLNGDGMCGDVLGFIEGRAS